MARFGDMLYQRRRQMGLTILQVANTIKIRPQIIEFFENGDFTAMPPRPLLVKYSCGQQPAS